MRSFVGVYPDRDFLGEIEKVRDLLNWHRRSLRLVDLGRIHLTLRFLGDDLSFDVVEEIYRDFNEKVEGFKKFELKPDGVCFGFGGERFPRSVYLKLESNNSIKKLVNIFEKVLTDKEIVLPKLEFIPHLTLAKTRGKLDSVIVDEIREDLAFIEFESKMLVSKLEFIRSDVFADGHKYTSLFEIELN